MKIYSLKLNCLKYPVTKSNCESIHPPTKFLKIIIQIDYSHSEELHIQTFCMMSKKRPNQTSISGFFSKVPKISANENQSQISSNNLSQNESNEISNQADFFTFMLARKKGGRGRVIFFRVCPPNNLDSATSLILCRQ